MKRYEEMSAESKFHQNPLDGHFKKTCHLMLFLVLLLFLMLFLFPTSASSLVSCFHFASASGPPALVPLLLLLLLLVVAKMVNDVL